jgi:predicted DNA-binding protein with PD1-like motif
MKGEYVEEKDHPNDMFAKLKFQPPPSSSHHHQQPHHFQLTTSDQADHHHHSPTTPNTTANKEANSSDGATIEAIRRPRGRPPGSKNKPKPPVFITRESDPSMSPYFLEIPTNADVVVSITKFCRKNSTGLTILSGSGAVANVTLRQPTAPGATVTFHGRFDLLSLSATILPPNSTIPSIGNGFSITLAGPQGQVIGGSVVGPLFAAGTVYLVAASFNNPSFHRLPVADEEERESAGKERELSSPVGSGGGGGGDRGDAAVETCGMSVYSGCQVGSDVIWAPTARQPPSSHYG